MNHQSLHISIVSYNTCDDLLACLESIYTNPPGRDFVVSVVDNGSSDNSVSMVRTQFPQAQVIISEGNIGYGRANNLAILESESEFTSILNSDLVLHARSLDKCCDYLDSHPKCGITGGALLNPDKSPQMNWAAGELNLNAIAFEQFFLASLFPKSSIFGDYFRTNWARNDTRNLPQVCGAFMVMRTFDFKAIGGFDPSYWMYCEDTDLCAKVRRHGLSCTYLHDATATHGHGSSSRGALRARMVLEHNVSRCIYVLKYYGRDRAQQARRMMILGSLLRVIVWGIAGVIKRDKTLLEKSRGYIRVLYGTRNILV